jgi:pimeloyl-ACP methyl ester carboxylesterase
MPYAQSKGVRLYYEVHGSGPAITLVHGSGGNHAAWWQQVPQLSRSFTVLLPDLRGFGLSDPVEGGPDSLDFVDDIRAVLDAARVERSVVLGQSIGAAPALRLAVAQPDRIAGVVLAHSLGGINDPDLAKLVAADRAEAEKLPVIDRLMSKAFQKDQPERTWLFRELGTFNHAKMQDLRNLSAKGPTIEEVVAADVPILFLGGSEDAVMRPETMRRAQAKLPGSALVTVPGAPHSMYWEQPTLFNEQVEIFLRKVYGA